MASLVEQLLVVSTVEFPSQHFIFSVLSAITRRFHRSHGRVRPDTTFIQMMQEIRRIVIGAIGPGAFQFVPAIAARQEPDTERGGPASRQQVPDTVTDDDALAIGTWSCSAAAKNKSGSGFACLT